MTGLLQTRTECNSEIVSPARSQVDARSADSKPLSFPYPRAISKNSEYLTRDNFPDTWLALVRRVLDFRAKVQLKKFRSQRAGTRRARPGRIFKLNDRWLMFACEVLPLPVWQDDDSRISHRTSLQWTPLFFTHDQDSEGGLSVTPSIYRLEPRI